MNLEICVLVIIYAAEKEEKSENEWVSGEMSMPGTDKNGGLMGGKLDFRPPRTTEDLSYFDEPKCP